ncbi:MAG: hypothetical protein KJO08_02420 [Gammaproteobacteria bacterium]|nr:hypothetical protein [Gammaproteobacteria bacterium]NNJ83332.1 hypothetical protein [Gammaproteobacteria bacterium]
MDKTNQLQAFLSRGERLFAKKSYIAAKKEFDHALHIAPDKDTQEKRRLCEEQIRLDQRKEQIKKARKLEKKGDIPGALNGFSAALAATGSTIQAEPWLQDKIAQLRHRLEIGQMTSAVEKADDEKDPSIRLALYDIALAQGADPAILEKKAGCLVEMDRYEEAVVLYANEATTSQSIPQSDQGRYDFGFALIACDRYLDGVAQWEPLLSDYPILFPQIITLLPYLTRELAEHGRGYALPRRILAIIAGTDSRKTSPAATQDPQLIDQYARYFDYCYLKELWYAGEHSAIPALLPSPPRRRDVSLLAKLYLSLSADNVEYLSIAITYWLTVIHDRDTLRSLHVHQDTPNVSSNAPSDEILRDSLLALLDKQVAAHARSDQLSPSLSAHWQNERRQIARLAALSIEPEEEAASSEGGMASHGSSSNEDLIDGDRNYFPCTPAFAEEFGISDKILRLLREKKSDFDLDEQDWLELYAGYLPLGQYMSWIDPGNEEKIFSALPGKAQDQETEYLRQRIAFRCGIGRVLAGGRYSRKYFQAAIPLLTKNPHLRQELIYLVYAETTSEKVISALSDAMEFLARRLDDSRFLEATAHCIGLDVENLMHQGVVTGTLEKRLDAGLAICPDCPQIQTTLSNVRREQNFRQLDKAMRAMNLGKAARIVVEAEDEEIKELFFDAMENAYDSLMGGGNQEIVSLGLRNLYEACCTADEEHWLTEQLGEDLLDRRLP